MTTVKILVYNGKSWMGTRSLFDTLVTKTNATGFFTIYQVLTKQMIAE